MFYEIAKRALDIVVSVVAIIVFSPILIAVALAVKFDGTGGSLFLGVQSEGADGKLTKDFSTRIGKNKKHFLMYKFRSMVPGAHVGFWEMHPELKELEAEWKHVGKLPIHRDPRITKIGRIIRKTDMDELAQFFNVLKGEMSVVGPRAPYPEELDRYIEEFPSIKNDVVNTFSVKPGITGVWQISGRNAISIPDRFKMEAKYAKEKNIWNDIRIIIMTPIVMLTRKGAME
jgi:lipopolysaccharide/colanic/teichoic acid biosynthesis glycosyltransferase